MKKYKVNFIAFEGGVARLGAAASAVQASGPKQAIRALNDELWGPEAGLLDGELYTVIREAGVHLRVYQIRDGKPKRVA